MHHKCDWWQLENGKLVCRNVGKEINVDFFLNIFFFKCSKAKLILLKSSSKHGKMGHKSLYPLKQKCMFKAEEVQNFIIKLKKKKSAIKPPILFPVTVEVQAGKLG